MKVRAYEEDRDFPVIAEWARYYLGESISPCGLPKSSGAVVEDDHGSLLCALFAFLPFDCGVAFAERFFAKPGITADTIRKAGRLAFLMIEELAKIHGYSLLISSFQRKGMTREAKALGFEEVGQVTIMQKRL